MGLRSGSNGCPFLPERTTSRRVLSLASQSGGNCSRAEQLASMGRKTVTYHGFSAGITNSHVQGQGNNETVKWNLGRINGRPVTGRTKIQLKSQ